MCGILGVFSKSEPISYDRLVNGVQQLQHRGPDAQKTWIGANGKVGLGHSRLSIIDLTSGDQPLTDYEESVHAVVNGELYGYEEIRSDMEKLGHRFKTRSDSEIVIHLYKEYGTDCLKHLRGEFALILWDHANGTFFAARDRFGIKPLYYRQNENMLTLASEIKALCALGSDSSWDSESIFQLHSSLVFLSSRTLFDGIYQIPPGHFLLATQGQTQIIKYWDFNYPTSKELSSDLRSEEDTINQLKSILHESVKIRLRADVPVACYLSGGLDSCSVLGIASQYLQKPMHAFTLSFDQEEYDEEKIAREMAVHSGAQFTSIQVTEKDLADHFEDAVWHCEIPIINTHAVAKFLLSKAVRDAGYKVVLTGEGSDEIFAGYPHFRRDMILNNTQNQDPAQIQILLQELRDSNLVSQGLLLTDDKIEEIRSLKSVLGSIPSFAESNSSVGKKLLPLLRSEFREPFRNRDPFKVLMNELDSSRQLMNRDPVNQALYLWSKTMLPNYILSVLGDRMEMGHSIEGRVPFMDHKLVEFVTKLPVHFKIRGTTEKFILREAAKNVLTDTVYRRQKHPFLAPPTSTRKGGPLLELIQDTLRGTHFRNLSFYEHNKVIDLLDRLPHMSGAEQTAVDPVLTLMVSFCFLQKKFSVK